MLRRLWLVFAQVCTVCVALIFTVSTLRPEWLARSPAAPAPHAPAPTASASSPSAPVTPVAVGGKPADAASVSVGGFRRAAERALPSVVKIATSARRPRDSFDNPFDPRSYFKNRREPDRQTLLGEGSGVIVRPDGYILTNNHVLEGAQQVQVELADRRVLPARLIGTDPLTDLAVIKVEANALPAVPLGNSQALHVGDIVLAIGNPFGVFGNTVTMGIVSALGRTQIAEGNPFESFIQTDAAINQGNSGGALVNVQGELVGINSAIFTRTGDFSGIGFAIPTAIAQPIMEQLIAHGEVKRGYIGANLGPVTPEIAARLALKQTGGAFVAAVLDGAPASRAGLRVNDVIVEVDGRATQEPADAINTIAMSAPEQTIPLKVLRGGETVDLKITLGRRPQPRR